MGDLERSQFTGYSTLRSPTWFPTRSARLSCRALLTFEAVSNIGCAGSRGCIPNVSNRECSTLHRPPSLRDHCALCNNQDVLHPRRLRLLLPSSLFLTSSHKRGNGICSHPKASLGQATQSQGKQARGLHLPPHFQDLTGRLRLHFSHAGGYSLDHPPFLVCSSSLLQHPAPCACTYREPARLCFLQSSCGKCCCAAVSRLLTDCMPYCAVTQVKGPQPDRLSQAAIYTS